MDVENVESQEEIVEEENENVNIQKPIGVYVKINEENFVTDVSSDVFIKNFEGWHKIDEGFGDKFAHAQGYYFDKPLQDEFGRFNINIPDLKK